VGGVANSCLTVVLNHLKFLCGFFSFSPSSFKNGMPFQVCLAPLKMMTFKVLKIGRYDQENKGIQDLFKKPELLKLVVPFTLQTAKYHFIENTFWLRAVAGQAEATVT